MPEGSQADHRKTQLCLHFGFREWLKAIKNLDVDVEVGDQINNLWRILQVSHCYSLHTIGSTTTTTINKASVNPQPTFTKSFTV